MSNRIKTSIQLLNEDVNKIDFCEAHNELLEQRFFIVRP